MTTADHVYSAVLRRNPQSEAALPEPVRRNVAPNGLRLVTAGALQASADHTVNASTVLPWLFGALGVPAALTGVLVPVRESGSMLPQAFLTPLVLRVRRRKLVFVAGALVQAVAMAAMVLTAAVGAGLPAGLVIVAALAVYSLGRCLCSIASKDVQGRTIPKGERGQINGLSTTASGLVAITLGVAVRVFGGADLQAWQLAWLLALGVVLWLAVALVYLGVREPVDEPASPGAPPRASDGIGDILALLRRDRPFRNFVTVRSLLLVSSLSPPFVVTLSLHSGAVGLAGLGGFVVASGLAALLGGRLFGRMADRSSRRLMSLGAGVASAIVLVVVAVSLLPGFRADGWAGNALFIGAFFGLTLMHTGVRVGRKTYVVDMAEGDQRTRYVAVSNTVMGVMLLVVGGVSSLLALVHVAWALLLLAGLGLVGVFAGARLPEVSAGK